MKKWFRVWCFMIAEFVVGFVCVCGWFLFADGLIESGFLFLQIVAFLFMLFLLVSAVVGLVLQAIDLVKRINYRLTLRAWKRKYGPNQKHDG